MWCDSICMKYKLKSLIYAVRSQVGAVPRRGPAGSAQEYRTPLFLIGVQVMEGFSM